MIWIFRIQRIIYTLVVGALAYVACLITGQGEWTSAFYVLAAIVLAGLWFWIELRRKFPDVAALNTNRHAFKSVQTITHLIPDSLKPAIVNSLGSFVHMKKGTGYGLGGSSSIASVFNHWQHRYNQKRGDIFLGLSPWDRNTAVGHNDDKAMVTFSEPRNGKGTSCIIPNLFLYPGGCG